MGKGGQREVLPTSRTPGRKTSFAKVYTKQTRGEVDFSSPFQSGDLLLHLLIPQTGMELEGKVICEVREESPPGVSVLHFRSSTCWLQLMNRSQLNTYVKHVLRSSVMNPFT